MYVIVTNTIHNIAECLHTLVSIISLSQVYTIIMYEHQVRWWNNGMFDAVWVPVCLPSPHL